MTTVSKTLQDDPLKELLSSLNWEGLWVRLMGRCYWVLRNRYRVDWTNQELNDFSRQMIQEAFNKIFVERSRNWNSERYPEFEEFIVGVIDSHINNTLKKSNKEVNIEELESFVNVEFYEGAEDILIADDLRKQVFDELESQGASDEELLIFECMADGILKPDRIKLELGMSDEDFHNAWRRLKRKRQTIQEKIAANGY